MGRNLAMVGMSVFATLVILSLMGAIESKWPAGKVTDIPGEFCKTIEVPASDEEFYTVWRAPRAATLTEIFCEVYNGTSVAFDFENDDGSPTGVNGSAVTCDTDGTTDSTLGGDTSMAAGDRLDIDLGTVTGDVDSFSACIRFTLD